MAAGNPLQAFQVIGDALTEDVFVALARAVDESHSAIVFDDTGVLCLLFIDMQDKGHLDHTRA